MIELNEWDWLKIVSSIAGIVMLWAYKKKIARLIEGVITDGESYHYEGVEDEQIVKEIEEEFRKVIG